MFAWVVIATLILSGCGGLAKPKIYTIGVINLAPTLEGVLTGFKQGMTELGIGESYIVTRTEEDQLTFEEGSIEVVPVWKFLLTISSIIQ